MMTFLKKLAGSTIGLLITLGSILPARAETTLTVMTFNIWGGGANEQKPVDETADVIRRAGADIIGLQETRLEGDPCEAESCPPTGESVAAKLAAALGYHHYDQTGDSPALWANAVISRYPIDGPLPKNLGVRIDVNGRTINAYNIHLSDFPYQPYQLLEIEYGPAPYIQTGEEAVHFALQARGSGLTDLVDAMTVAGPADASFVFGDFNEPSHLDWTDRAVTAGLQPVPVAYPVSSKLAELGFLDAYRTAFPNEVAKPGFTWTPGLDPTDPEDHLDRIDYIYVKGSGLKILKSQVWGEAVPQADVAVEPWPSDHRAVTAEVKF